MIIFQMAVSKSIVVIKKHWKKLPCLLLLQVQQMIRKTYMKSDHSDWDAIKHINRDQILIKFQITFWRGFGSSLRKSDFMYVLLFFHNMDWQKTVQCLFEQGSKHNNVTCNKPNRLDRLRTAQQQALLSMNKPCYFFTDAAFKKQADADTI